ncbi:MAG: hypothetical protein LRY62_01820 [Alphaproteobacteria bacterium]|nr:hypothetical protein [Alphaproteobacteria bacterium]
MSGLLVNEERRLRAEDFLVKKDGEAVLSGRPVLGASDGKDMRLEGDISLAAGEQNITLHPHLGLLYQDGILHITDILSYEGNAKPDEISAALEALRLDIQKASGYLPAREDGYRLLFGIPLDPSAIIERQEVSP